MPMSYSVTFWGTRGTIPVPGHGTARHGGNTPCVAVRDGAGRCLVLDAGTGIRGLGQALRREAFEGRIDLLLSHVHWDHIQGLPFFAPLFADGQDIRVHGPAPVGAGLASVLERQLEPAVYPVPRAARAAHLSVQEVGAGSTIEIQGFRVECCALSHPGGALGYRITPDGGGPVLAYLTDNELGAGGASRVSGTWRDDLVRFVRGAALLIHDGMYTSALAEERSGWGHSSALDAVALAGEAGVDHLALFHHDPDHDDAQVDGVLAMARAAAPAALTVSAAREGWTETL